MIIGIIIFIIIFLILLGLPLYIGILGLSTVLFWSADLSFASLIINFKRIYSQEFVAAIPLFTYAGYVIARSKTSDRIVLLFQPFSKVMPGMNAVIVVLLMAFFTALTGASGVSILALGGVLYPFLVKNGYSEKLSIGLITGSGSIGLLFAPSLPVILYAIIASQNMSIGKVGVNVLFQVALIPSIILISAVSLYAMWVEYRSNRHNTKKLLKKNNLFQEFLQSLWIAKFDILLPFIVYGGIYTGLFTVIETSMITALYVTIIAFFVNKDISFKSEIVSTIMDSMKLSGGIFIIMASSIILTDYFVNEKIPMRIFDFISPYLESRLSFLLLLNLFLILCGCLLDIFSAILIVLPILIPIVEQYGIHPYHFAIIFLINLEIGYITPPVGMNLFISGYRFNKSITFLYRSTFPYLVIMFLLLILFTYIEPISTFTLSKKEFNNQEKLLENKEANFNIPLPVENLKAIEITLSYIVIEFTPAIITNQQGGYSIIDEYDIRFSDFPINNEEDFEFADSIIGENKYLIDDINNVLKVKIDFLEPGVNYWIAVKSKDKYGNLSPMTVLKEILTK